MTPTISIAICSYNPDRRLLVRLLSAIQKLHYVESVERIVIIDNNSNPPLSNLVEVQTFLDEQHQAVCLEEAKPGLNAARCRAIRETESDVVVFFDDDNEPATDYLTILMGAFEAHPCVGVWGPGVIKVYFVDNTPPEIRKRPHWFQEKTKGFGYACCPGLTNEYFPIGTGFAVRRTVLQAYASAVESGRLQTTGRIGNSLGGGDDAQIVWECYKLEMAAGLLPSLACCHLICNDKANLSYVTRNIFGAGASHWPAFKQSFPEFTPSSFESVSRIELLRRLTLLLYVKQFKRPGLRIDYEVGFAYWLGEAYGKSIALCHPSQDYIYKVARLLGYT